MKIKLICATCAFSESERPPQKIYGIYQSVNNTGLYKIECPLGHTTEIIAQGQRFEFLFDLGFFAIADGYFREAVASFTSALERFYEFYINVICLKNNIPQEAFANSWKNISKQSERQVGAFVYVYLLEKKASPVLLSNNNIEFRNSVIHQGFFPDREKAISYGKAVSDIIHPIFSELKDDNNYEFVHKMISSQVEKSGAVGQAEHQATYGSPFYFNSAVRNVKEKSFDEYLTSIEEGINEIRFFPNGFWWQLDKEGKTVGYIAAE